MKLTRFAAIAAALTIGVSSPVALHADGLTFNVPITPTHSTRTTSSEDFLNRLQGQNPRFDYTMWLSPNLELDESTVAHGLGTLERYQRMKEATVYIENQKATTDAGSIGSGVILDNKNCWVLTNDHVTEGADFLYVSYVNGWVDDGTPLVERVSATVIGHPGDSNQGFDLTLLQMDYCEGAAWAPILHDHTLVHDGEMSVAVGNPLGQTWTFTMGVVSHTARIMDSSPWPMLQTDASVNRGNSGGPLFDQNGEVIGINTLILSQSGDNNGLAFAVRSDLLRLFMNNMYRYGQMQVNRIGIMIGGISKAEARIMDIPGGVLVSEVVEGSPAHEAGIQKGDIITHVDGVLSDSQNRIIMSVWSSEPNIGAEARILRPNDQGGYDELPPMIIPVRNAWESDYTPPQADVYEDLMGWTLEAEERGVMVTDVAAMGPAHRLDMEPENAERDLNDKGPIQDGDTPWVGSFFANTRVSMIVHGVKAQGQAKLDLKALDINQRVAALEAYIREANGEPVVLYITIARDAEVIAKRADGSVVELPLLYKRGLSIKHQLESSERDMVLYAQPEAYTAPVDLDNWVPPVTGN